MSYGENTIALNFSSTKLLQYSKTACSETAIVKNSMQYSKTDATIFEISTMF